MPPPKKQLTPLEISLKELDKSITRAKGAWSFDNARTLAEMLKAMGFPDPVQAAKDYGFSEVPLNSVITFKDIEDVWRKRFTEFLIKQHSAPTTAIAPVATKALSLDEALIDDEVYNDLDDTDYYKKQPAGQIAKLTKAQIRVAKHIVEALTHGQRSAMILAGTGTGKTFVIGSIIKNLVANGFLAKHRTFSPWPIVVITKASVVIQTHRVLKKRFGLDPIRHFHVINIEQLRADFGSLFIDEEVVIENGKPYYKYKWKNTVHPLLFIWDECQIIKNDGAQQSMIAQDVNEIENRYNEPVFQIFSSATPFTKVSEARCFTVSTKIPISIGLAHGVPITNKTWPMFAKEIAYPADPTEDSPAAVERLRNKLDRFIYQMKNVRSKFKARNGVSPIDFKTDEERESYENAWNDYLIRKTKIEGLEGLLSASQSRMLLLAQFTIFTKRAEKIRVPHLTEFCVKNWEAGQAPVLAVRYKGTILGVCMELINKHHWKREDISVIWGGAVKQKLTQKQERNQKLYSDEDLLKALSSVGINLADFGIFKEEVATYTPAEELFIKTHNLGAQNPKNRQDEIDRFQSQRSRVCIYTFSAGGVGLSLHHEFPETRQRVVLFTPVYSAIMLVQGIGRCPRLTSLSDTSQSMVYYRKTIEAQVAVRVADKLRCLSKVVRQRESWDDIIIGKGRTDYGERNGNMPMPTDVIEQENTDQLNLDFEDTDDKDDDEENGNGD